MEEDRDTLELPAADEYELDEEEKIEVLLDWCPVVGQA